MPSSSLTWQLDGEELSTGEQAWADGLAPGEHTVTLLARDSDGQQAQARRLFSVNALQVPAGDTPQVDGSCDDDAYATAATLMLAPYADGAQATVKLLRSGANLYACFSGLDLGTGPTASVGLHLDPDGSADRYAQADDYLFSLHQDNYCSVGAGDGSGDYIEGPNALRARLYQDATTWSAELCIDLSILAPIGAQSRIAVAHYWVQEEYDDHAWPYTSSWSTPQSWAECHLGSTDVYLPVVLKRFRRMPPAPVPTPTPTHPSGVKPVLFDEAHDSAKTLSWQRAQSLLPEHPDWVYCGQMAQDLSDEFTLVRNVDQPFTAGLLAAYNAVILPSLDGGLTEAERTALEDYMEAGGGVLWLGGSEWVADEFTQAWGVHLDGRVIFEVDGDGDYEVTDFAAHPAVSGVTRMVTNWDGSLDVSPPAVVLITSPATGVFRDLNDNQSYDDGEPTGSFDLAAAYESGRARMIVQSGSPYQDHGEEWRDNTPLMRAFLRWLTAARP